MGRIKGILGSATAGDPQIRLSGPHPPTQGSPSFPQLGAPQLRAKSNHRIFFSFNTKGILGRRKCITEKGSAGAGKGGASLSPSLPKPWPASDETCRVPPCAPGGGRIRARSSGTNSPPLPGSPGVGGHSLKHPRALTPVCSPPHPTLPCASRHLPWSWAFLPGAQLSCHVSFSQFGFLAEPRLWGWVWPPLDTPPPQHYCTPGLLEASLGGT